MSLKIRLIDCNRFKCRIGEYGMVINGVKVKSLSAEGPECCKTFSVKLYQNENVSDVP